MIYFDNAATGGTKPDSVLRAVRASIEGVCGNPGRSGHSLSVALAENILHCRKLLCDFFHSDSYERVILTKNCTEALNIALFGCADAHMSRQKPHFITTVMEHNSVLRPLTHLQKTNRAEVTIVPLRGDTVSPQDIAAALRPNTVAAVFTLASNVTGAAVDPSAVRALLPQSVYILCDGAQACGHRRIDMKKEGIDALALAGHKGMHGIQGSGALLFSQRLELAPVWFGGTGSESFSTDMPDFYPDRLEAGTLSCPAAASLTEGTLYLMSRIERLERELFAKTKQLIDGLLKIDAIAVYSRPNPYGIVAFRCKNLQSEFFAQRLSDEYCIAVRGGLHCAPLMHRALHTDGEGLIRASLSEFNTDAEMQIFLQACAEIAKN